MPTPPARGLAASAADKDVYHATRKLRGTPRWALATKDANLEFPPASEVFSCGLDMNGTKKLLASYGDRLICVRYRYDAERKLRHKTVELIVETARWSPRARNARRQPGDMVGVRVAYAEADLRERIKAAGDLWRFRHKLWELDWRTVRKLGLQERAAD